jgi:hypothetical protein
LIAGISLLPELALSQAAGAPTPPSYCQPCLFYGGDFDASNPAATALSNGFVYEDFSSATYVPFFVPEGEVWTVKGLFSNNMSTVRSLPSTPFSRLWVP